MTDIEINSEIIENNEPEPDTDIAGNIQNILMKRFDNLENKLIEMFDMLYTVNFSNNISFKNSQSFCERVS